ncbi:unnamed protein product, partial [Rotaria magnacalcarata]
YLQEMVNNHSTVAAATTTTTTSTSTLATTSSSKLSIDEPPILSAGKSSDVSDVDDRLGSD